MRNRLHRESTVTEAASNAGAALSCPECLAWKGWLLDDWSVQDRQAQGASGDRQGGEIVRVCRSSISARRESPIESDSTNSKAAATQAVGRQRQQGPVCIRQGKGACAIHRGCEGWCRRDCLRQENTLRRSQVPCFLAGQIRTCITRTLLQCCCYTEAGTCPCCPACDRLAPSGYRNCYTQARSATYVGEHLFGELAHKRICSGLVA